MRLYGVSVVAFLLSGALVVAADRPNILWLTSEDHGPHLGCYGDSLARTPNVDALAARGMIFNKVWSCAPVCAPARTCIITGLYPSSSGGQHMRSMVPLPPNLKLYPQYLREAGYYCTNNVKTDYNVRVADDLWDQVTNKAHWRNRREGQPFFAIFNSTKSHESQIRTRPHQQITDPAKVRIPAYHPDTPEVRQDWAQYYDKVSEADADAGQRLRELEADGLAADTIIFYYADHGSGMPRSKRWPCNSGLHVPLVVYFPEKWRHLAPKEYRPGGKSDRLVNFVDLAPTLLSLAGVEPPDWMQGHAFAGKYQSEPQPYLFGERGRMDERLDAVRSCTDGRYVYLRNFFPHLSQGQHLAYQFETPTTRVWRQLFDEGKTNEAQSLFWQVPKSPEELYDLQTDPDEVHNLMNSAPHRSILEKLRAVQRAHATAIRDICILPEVEMHSRSHGSTPYETARDTAGYPLERVLAAAEMASNLQSSDLKGLNSLLGDDDSAVRYWAAMGFLMRGQDAVTNHLTSLRKAMTDQSPYVRIAAAEAVAKYGTQDDLNRAKMLLSESIEPDRNGVFVSMSALWAVDALGSKAASLHEQIRTMNPKGPSPHARYDEYVPRLIKSITSSKGP